MAKLINKLCFIRENSIFFNYWKDPPAIFHHKVYFFNVTNADEIISIGAKPQLTEIGPFTYRMKLSKTNIVFNNNDTVSYRERRTWFFDPSLSVDSEDAKIVTLNAPLTIAFTFVLQYSSPIRQILLYALNHANESLFIQRSVKELMFHGYDDSFLSMGSIVSPKFAKNKGKFGYYWPKNGTDDGLFTVHTGSDINLLALIDRINGQEKLKLWASDECNRFNESTLGQIQPPILAKSQKVKVFNPAFCRSLSFEFLRTEKTKDGFTARKFLLSKKTFLNASDYPPNACFESKLPKKSYQTRTSFLEFFSLLKQKTSTLSFPSGVMDMSKCLSGAPIIFSLPHFLHAHHSFLDAINGLSPNALAHDFWLDIEPATGTTVDMAFRTQINLHINLPIGLSHYNNSPQIVFPVLWQEVGIHWPENFIFLLKFLIYTPITVSSI
ncbi:Scavenger receptor class B member 1-like protein, partial [Dinothrombium tinctorium]